MCKSLLNLYSDNKLATMHLNMICDTYILFPPTASSFLDENTTIYIAALCAVIGVIAVLLVIVSCCLCVLRRKSRSMISYMECFCCFM